MPRPILSPVGTITLTKNGYLLIKLESGKWVSHHRYVMECHLKRELAKDEHVHHRNGNKSDNRIENLVIVSPNNHGKYHGGPRGKYWRSLPKAGIHFKN